MRDGFLNQLDKDIMNFISLILPVEAYVIRIVFLFLRTLFGPYKEYIWMMGEGPGLKPTSLIFIQPY